MLHNVYGTSSTRCFGRNVTYFKMYDRGQEKPHCGLWGVSLSISIRIFDLKKIFLIQKIVNA